MIVFTVFFGHLAKIPSDGVPYPVFAYCALVPWIYFAYAMGESSNSLVTNANLISKVYFPRLVIPLAATLAGLVDFAIAFVVLIGMMLFFHIVPTWAIIFLPAFLLLAIATAMAVGLWLSALNVRYRDVRYTVPFLIQIWMFCSPVAYPTSLLPGVWRTVYGLNPMAGVVDGFRWALLGKPAPSLTIAASVVAVCVLLAGGLTLFSTDGADLCRCCLASQNSIGMASKRLDAATLG